MSPTLTWWEALNLKCYQDSKVKQASINLHPPSTKNFKCYIQKTTTIKIKEGLYWEVIQKPIFKKSYKYANKGVKQLEGLKHWKTRQKPSENQLTKLKNSKTNGFIEVMEYLKTTMETAIHGARSKRQI